MKLVFNVVAWETKSNHLVLRCRWIVKPWISNVVSFRWMVQGVVLFAFWCWPESCNFSRYGRRLWHALNHKSVWLFRAWGTSSQNGFLRELSSEIGSSVIARVWRRSGANVIPLFPVMWLIVASRRIYKNWLDPSARCTTVSTLRLVRTQITCFD